MVALVVVVSMNLISVKVFGELEFWASLVKVLALVTFLVVGTVFLAGRFKVDGQDTGPGLWSSHGGLLPSGLLPLVLVTSGVVFAYAAIELVGIAAGETENPGEDHAARDQLGGVPHRGLLRRVDDPAGAAAALHRLPR